MQLRTDLFDDRLHRVQDRAMRRGFLQRVTRPDRTVGGVEPRGTRDAAPARPSRAMTSVASSDALANTTPALARAAM